MQTYILTISKTLDEVFITNTSSSSITLHSEENESKQSQQKLNETNSCK
uniref:Uncharacterized protein n=1 Tax=Wuchereria bancrofti TaxID=6293 RepID=A0AAF5Q612_WUCBA